MDRAKYLRMILLVAGALAVLLIIERFKLPDHSFFFRELNNAGHTPLFGILGLLILGVLRIVFSGRLIRPAMLFWLAFAVTCVLALLSEWLQYGGARDADPMDFLRDLAGAASFLAVRWSWQKLTGPSGIQPVRRRLWWRAIGVMVFAGALVPLVLWSGAYAYRSSIFPNLTNLENCWSNKFLRPQDAEMDIVPHPDCTTDNDCDMMARLKIRPAEYSGLALVEPYPDWSEYRSLAFQMYSPLQDTIDLQIRINDAVHDNDYRDRFNRTLTVVPGINLVEIALDDVRWAPQGREMDMTSIVAIVLFSWQPADTFTVFVGDFSLK